VRFLADVTSPVHTVNHDGDPQEEFDEFYGTLLSLLDTYCPEQPVTVASSDPPIYITPAAKHAAVEAGPDLAGGGLGPAVTGVSLGAHKTRGSRP